MEEDRLLVLLESLEPFTLAQFHNSMSLFWHLRKLGFSLEEVSLLNKRLLKEKPRAQLEKLRKKQLRLRAKSRYCPLCNRVLDILPIGTPEGKANVRGFRSVWLCPGETCFFEEYSLRSKAEEFINFFKPLLKKETENA